MSDRISELSVLSVVIPTLDAAGDLPRCLAALRSAGAALVVVDGGSADATRSIAEAHGAKVVSAERGRGTQLIAGAAAAVTDWLLFLHADTVLEPGWDQAVAGYIANPRAADGVAVFRFALDDPSLQARWLEAGVRLRAQLFGLPFGDQGLPREPGCRRAPHRHSRRADRFPGDRRAASATGHETAAWWHPAGGQFPPVLEPNFHILKVRERAVH